MLLENQLIKGLLVSEPILCTRHSCCILFIPMQNKHELTVSRCVDDVCASLMKRVWGTGHEETEKHMHCVHLWANEWKMEPTVCMRARMCVCVSWHVWGGVWASRGKAHKTHDRTDEVTGSETGESLSFPVWFHPSLHYFHLSISFLVFLRQPCWELIGLSLTSRMSNWPKTKV